MTIQDIAKATGFSTATVSRAINRSGYVKEETRVIIEAFIKENRYVPSAIARSLSKQETNSVGVIIPDIENTFFPQVIRGIRDVAEKQRLVITLFGTNENPDEEHSTLQLVREQRVKGIIITPTSNLDKETKYLLEEFRSGGVPVVLLDRDIHHSDFDGVFIENTPGAKNAIDAFVANGHTKIAIIAGPETSKPGKDRLKGYKKAMEAHNLPLREDYIMRGDFRLEQGYELTKKLMTMPDPPTAILASNNMTTLGCLKYLTENHFIPGQNISLIGFDEIEELRSINYNLSVVARETTRMGESAMNILLDRLNEKEVSTKPLRLTYPTKLILRGSEKYCF